jgi:hypothetical protein
MCEETDAALPADARQAAYVASGGTRCLHCGHAQLEGGPVEVDGGGASQEVRCPGCGRGWLDLYTLTGVAEEED